MSVTAVCAYRTVARSTRGGAGTVTARRRSIEFDASAGQSDILPGPADLLAAAFAACVLKSVERFSHLLPFRYERATVEVTAEREDSPPRMTAVRYVLHVATDEPADRIELLHGNVRRYGTVVNTLDGACDVAGEIVAVAPEGT